MQHVKPTKRIMVVDDDPGMCETLGMIIGTCTSHQVETFTSPLQALEQARAGGFHLIVSDIQMPMMDGVTLLKQVKATNPGIEVVLLTGYNSAERSRAALQNRAFDCIEKPIDIATFLTLLGNALTKQELGEQLNSISRTISTLEAELEFQKQHIQARPPSGARPRAEVSCYLVSRRASLRTLALLRMLEAIEAMALGTGAANEVILLLRLLRQSLTVLRHDFAQVEASRTQGHGTLVWEDFGEVVDAVITACRPFFPDVQLELSPLPQMLDLDFDPASMAVLLASLIEDAARSAGPGARLTVAVVDTPAYIDVLMMDTSGPGPAEEELSPGGWRQLGASGARSLPPEALQRILNQHRARLTSDRRPGGRFQLKLTVSRRMH